MYTGGHFNCIVSDLNQLSNEMLPNNVNVFSKEINLDKTLNKRRKTDRLHERYNKCIILNGTTNSDYLIYGNYTSDHLPIALTLNNVLSS